MPQFVFRRRIFTMKANTSYCVASAAIVEEKVHLPRSLNLSNTGSEKSTQQISLNVKWAGSSVHRINPYSSQYFRESIRK